MNTLDLTELLKQNAYPGRGIVLGRSADNRKAVLIYFIMGRSSNSRNRVFVETPDGIRTQAFDPAKLEDPSLIIYAPVRRFGTSTIVTNGDQTDTIRAGLAAGEDFVQALRKRTFEPDGPNFTPRISGIVEDNGDYALSILKSADGDPASCRRYFFEYSSPLAGQGHFIHTYQCDGSPLPSFAGEPTQITVPWTTPEECAQVLWENLNEENKVSLFVRFLDLESGEGKSVIVNKNA